MSVIKTKFDSAQEQICDLCSAKILPEENKTIIGLNLPDSPWLWIYHPGCYEITQQAFKPMRKKQI